MRIGRAAVLGALVLACGPRERAPDEKAALGGEVAARVGGQPIPLVLVAEVARAQRVSAPEAARKVIDDEIAAAAARAKGVDKQQPTAWKLVAARARLVTDRLLEDAKRKGPPTDAEVAMLSERHWAEVDRPPTMRVVHAIALKPTKGQSDVAAKEIADKLRAAAAQATSVDDFQQRTKAVAVPKDVKVVVEELPPPFASDGRTPGGAPMDKRFATAAHALGGAGSTSGVVESDFGWHVIRVIERFPEARMPFEDRRVAFTEEVFAMRSHNVVTALLKGLVARHPVEISPAAESLMSSIPITGVQASLP